MPSSPASRRKRPPQPAPSVLPATEGRLYLPGSIVNTFATRPWASDVEQIPASVIDTGTFRFVRYVSYQAERFELNIYGDPQHPAGVEIGVYAGDESIKKEIRGLMEGFLQSADDRDLLHNLSLEQGKRTRNGLTFEITPSTAEDAYGAWWISIYDLEALDRARVSNADMKVVSEEASKEQREALLKKKRARKPSKSSRVYIEDNSLERGGDSSIRIYSEPQ